MNIEIDPSVSMSDLKGKPLTLICEIAQGRGGKPVLVSRHPYKLRKVKRAGEMVLELRRA